MSSKKADCGPVAMPAPGQHSVPRDDKTVPRARESLHQVPWGLRPQILALQPRQGVHSGLAASSELHLLGDNMGDTARRVTQT